MAKTISFHSFSRGVGKSYLSANIAGLLANKGRAIGLVDADLLAPTLNFLVGLDNGLDKNYVNNYLAGKCPIEQTAYNVTARVGLSQGCLHLIPADTDTAQVLRVLREGYNAERLHDGFRALVEKLRLDVLVADTHAGLDQDVLSLMLTDILVIALRMDKQEYTGTAVMIELARRLNVPRIVLVVNQIARVYDPSQVRAEVEKTYGCEVAGVLPYSEDVPAFASSGAGLFALRYADHPATLALKQLAAKLIA